MNTATTAIRVASLEISLADHCNLKCQSCDHASPHLQEGIADVATIERDLQALRGVLFANEIRLAGGEPLLHPELLEVVGIARESGVSREVTLITNGVLLNRALESLWGAIDCLWISIYPSVKHQWKVRDIQVLCRTHGVRLFMNHKPVFRLTMLNERISERLARFVYRNCCMAHRWSCQLVREGRFYMCPPAALMEDRLNLLGIEFPNKQRDSVALHDNPNLRQELITYLANTKAPLEACSYCLGSIGREIRHRQLSATERRGELEESHKHIASLVGAKGILRSLIKCRLRRSRVLKSLEQLRRSGPSQRTSS